MQPSTRAALLFTLVIGPSSLRAQAPANVIQQPAAEEPGPNNLKQNAPDEAFLNSQRQQRDNSRSQLTATTDGEVDLKTAVAFSMEGGKLEVEADFPSDVRARRFKIKDAAAILTVTQSISNPTFNGVPRPPIHTLSLNRIDTDVKDDKALWTCHVSRSTNYISMSGQSVVGRISFMQSTPTNVNVNVVNRAPPIRLSVMEWQAGPRLKPVLTTTANSIEELRARNPEAFRQYLVPLFKKFSDVDWMMPGATDVYSVFSEIPADEAASAKLQRLLPDLDDGLFATREAASRQMMELGEAGALAALRMDPASLSDEQKGQLGRLMAAYRRREVEDASAARRDTAFLTDCLEYKDLRVREAAKLSLQKVLGKEIMFDANLSGEALAAAADAVRKQALEWAPTTQPVEGKAEPAPGAVQPNLIVR